MTSLERARRALMASAAAVATGAVAVGAAGSAALAQDGAYFDSFYAEPMIFTIDASQTPAVITEATTVTGGAHGEAGYDLEGIAVHPDGGFWLASEGRPGDGRPNLLIRTDADGAITEEVTLPEGFEDGARNNGYEGVAIGPVGGETRVITAIQRDWAGDPDNHVKLGVYDPEAGS
jgi:hypothetical protein